MKKLSIYIIITVICIFSIAGCNRYPSVSTNEIPNQNSNQSSEQQVSPNTSSTENTSNTSNTTNTDDYIGEDAAKSAAFEHANISETDVTWIWTQLDFDDGRMVYDVEFICGNEEYDYEIDALSGEILSYDYDMESNYTPNPSTGDNTEYITVDEAKSIALARAELTENDVTFKKANLDYDDGRAIYDVEFVSGDMEYEFEINAVDGTILDYGVDSVWD